MKRSAKVIDLAALLALMGIALTIRLIAWHLKFFDIDEFFQLFIASMPTWGRFLTAVRITGPNQLLIDHAIDYIAFHFTRDIVYLRLLPLFWGVAAVGVTYILGRKLGSATFAWMWAFLLSISCFHINYSLTLRPYSLVLLLSQVSLLFIFMFLDSDAWGWPYALSVVLYQGVYFYAALKSLLDVLYVWYRKPSLRFKVFLAVSISWILLATWLFLPGTRVGSYVYFYDLKDAFSRKVLMNLWVSFGQNDPFIAVLFTAMFVTGVVVGFRSKSHRALILYGLALFFGTLVSIFISLLHAHYFFEPRHAIGVYPVYLGFVALGFVAVCGWLAKRLDFLSKNMPVVLITLASLWVGYLSLDPMSRWAREQQGSIQYFRNDVSFLKTAIKPRDTIIFAEPNAGAIFLYSYDPNAFFHLTGTEIHRGFAYFRFPPHLNADNGSFANPVFVFCSYNRTASTIDAPLLFQMRKKSKKKGGSFWLVDMQYRRIPINLLFSILGISSKDCQLMAPGIILYKGM